jgi:hypothetical protein
VIVRELNRINIEQNGRTISINFASFSFEVINERLLIYDASELVLVLPADKDLINQAYAAINIKGKQGERGLQGLKGDKGDKGETGDKGEKGDTGERGEKGEQGEQGEKGTDGINGTDGKDGTNGINGINGKDGIDGKDGKDGRNGTNGTNGIDGTNGLDGEKGADGSNGSNGVDGLSFNFKGDWEEEVTYKLQDVVRLERALFIALTETTNRPIFIDDINEDWELFLLDGRNGRNGRDGTDGTATETFNEITFDVTNDVLPITSPSVNYLNIDFKNFNGDIDLTNQLPTNLPKGARVILRKIDTNRGRITYNDSVIFYNFVKKKGEYIELIWNGTKFII